MTNPKPKSGTRPRAPRPRRRGNHQVDQDCFVADVVERRLGPAELARRHRQSVEDVHAILAGRKYRRIARRIELALACERQQARWRLAALQADAVQALEDAVRGKPSAASLSAAKEILSLAAGDEKPKAKSGRRKPKRRPGAMSKMPGETKRRILAELGGPQPIAD